MKKIFIIHLAVAFIIIFGYYIYKKSKPAKVVYERTSYSELVEIENKYEGSPPSPSFWDTLSTRTISIEQEVPLLVFRFTEISCNTCVNRDIRLLRSFAESHGWDRIIFFATNSDSDYLERFRVVSQIKTEIINVEANFLSIDQAKLDTPYLFTIDSDSVFEDVFISMKENEQRTKLYFNRIAEEFKN